jgi:hypothetical protein
VRLFARCVRFHRSCTPPLPCVLPHNTNPAISARSFTGPFAFTVRVQARPLLPPARQAILAVLSLDRCAGLFPACARAYITPSRDTRSGDARLGVQSDRLRSGGTQVFETGMVISTGTQVEPSGRTGAMYGAVGCRSLVPTCYRARHAFLRTLLDCAEMARRFTVS